MTEELNGTSCYWITLVYVTYTSYGTVLNCHYNVKSHTYNNGTFTASPTFGKILEHPEPNNSFTQIGW
jgi:hypothetical protein